MKTTCAATFCVLLLLYASCSKPVSKQNAQAGEKPPVGSTADRLYVTNEVSGDMSIVDSGTYQVLATVPLGKRPRGIHASPDGKTIYVLAADYNFGQLSEKWTRKIASENGAKVVASEFFPLDVAQFGPTISKIQAAKPAFIINTFVGPAHASFYGQWAAAGMKNEIPIASQTFGEGGEILRMPPEVAEGITVCYNYLDEIDTASNKVFLQRMRTKFGSDFGYIGDLGVNEYQGLLLWAEAVKKAGTLDREAVIKALESGISIVGPSGDVSLDPVTHHCIFNMYLAVAGKDRKFIIQEKFEKVRPTNPNGVCDLIKRPETNVQFQPEAL